MIPIFLENACRDNALVALGTEACGKFKGLPKGFVFMEASIALTLTAAELSDSTGIIDMLNALVASSIAARSQADLPRLPILYPYYPDLANFEPSGGEPNIQTEGFGSGRPNGITAYSEKYTILDGGECLYRQLAALEERPLQIFKIDSNDVIYGTLTTQSDVIKLKGLSCYVSVTPRENTGAQSGAIILTITYGSNYKKERDNQIAITLGEELKTMHDISVHAISATEYKIVSSCSGKSITAGNATLAALFTTKSVYLMNGAFVDVADLNTTYVATTDSYETQENAMALSLARDMFTASAGEASFKYLLGNVASRSNPFAK